MFGVHLGLDWGLFRIEACLKFFEGWFRVAFGFVYGWFKIAEDWFIVYFGLQKKSKQVQRICSTGSFAKVSAKMEQGGIGVMAQLYHKSGEAESGEAKKQKSKEAGKQKF